MKMVWRVRRFEDFSLEEFHDLIQLRIEVFVLEQDCPYQELDGLDKSAWHVTGENEDGELLACSRIIAPGISCKEVSFGRVLTKLNVRGEKIGHEVVKRTIAFIEKAYPGQTMKISAQKHLKKFYEYYKFKQSGEGYLEDGIPHIPMKC